MKVLIAASEAAPYAKTGGLGDVIGSLIRELPRLGVKARLILPLYRMVRDNTVLRDTGHVIRVGMGRKRHTARIFSHGDRALFIQCDEFFDRPEIYGTPQAEYPDNAHRFVFFSRGVLEACRAMGYFPDVIHCNDWQTGLIPLYIKTLYRRHFRKTATLLTIHNLGYQGTFPASAMTITGLPHECFNPDIMEFYGQVNLLKAGIASADALSTVSDNYAREIITKQYGFGLEGVLRNRVSHITGILNGIDRARWAPSTDGMLPAKFSAGDLSGKDRCRAALVAECGFRDGRRPLVGMVGRLSGQKGIDLFLEAAAGIFSTCINVVVLGRGEEHFHRKLREAAKKFPANLSLNIGYDEAFAHRIYAGADIFLMPSRYEPCGLAQMIALRYGTVPVARSTGGLADTIEDYDHIRGTGTGFLFAQYNSSALEECLKRALCVYTQEDRWKALLRRGMGRNFTWMDSARKYAALYRALARKVAA